MPQTKTQVAILVEDQYQVLEVWYPLLRLREAGFTVKTVGTGSKTVYPSKEGYPCPADMTSQEVRAEDFAAVVIPGGWAPDFLRRDPRLVQFVKAMYDSGKTVAAICHGGWMLVSAGVLKGQKATGFFAIKDDLVASGAQYLDQEVVVDKNLITSRKPEDLPRFVSEIIQQLPKA